MSAALACGCSANSPAGSCQSALCLQMRKSQKSPARRTTEGNLSSALTRQARGIVLVRGGSIADRCPLASSPGQRPVQHQPLGRFVQPEEFLAKLRRSFF